MKKISKKFLFIILMFLTAGSIAFGGYTYSQNIKLTHQVQQLEKDLSHQVEVNEELTEQLTTSKESEQYLLEEVDNKNAEIEKLNKEVTALKKK